MIRATHRQRSRLVLTGRYAGFLFHSAAQAKSLSDNSIWYQDDVRLGGRHPVMRALGICAVLVVTATQAMSQGALPNPARTPGALNPMVTQATIGSTICVRGWTQTVRPPSEYTSALKLRQVSEFGYADRKIGDYEEDYLIPLVFGGAPDDARNL